MSQESMLGMLEGIFPKSARELSPLELAYIGDGIYEIFIRVHLLQKGVRKTQELQKQAVSYVSAVAQAESCHSVLPSLSEEELEIVKKGRNAKSGHTPKSASVHQYRYSTGLEALIGYLYLERKQERIEELMKNILEAIEKENGS